jgi:hypothetical protein
VSEFDLQGALTRLCPLSEDFEDQPRPVDDLCLEGFLEVALLDGRQSVIDDDESDLVVGDLGSDFLDLAGAEQRSRPKFGERHCDPVDDVEINRLGEADSLGDARLGIPALRGLAVTALPFRDGDDDESALGCRSRRVGRLVRFLWRVLDQSESRPEPSSGSKSCRGRPGMIVEIACL